MSVYVCVNNNTNNNNKWLCVVCPTTFGCIHMYVLVFARVNAQMCDLVCLFLCKWLRLYMCLFRSL